MPPKGHVAIRVGVEEPERFVVPLVHLSHPLFVKLLEEAEEEYGFEQKGTIVIPCSVEYFRHVQGMIHGDGGGYHHHHHLPHFAGCFKA